MANTSGEKNESSSDTAQLSPNSSWITDNWEIVGTVLPSVNAIYFIKFIFVALRTYVLVQKAWETKGSVYNEIFWFS